MIRGCITVFPDGSGCHKVYVGGGRIKFYGGKTVRGACSHDTATLVRERMQSIKTVVALSPVTGAVVGPEIIRASCSCPVYFLAVEYGIYVCTVPTGRGLITPHSEFMHIFLVFHYGFCEGRCGKSDGAGRSFLLAGHVTSCYSWQKDCHESENQYVCVRMHGVMSLIVVKLPST